MSEYENIIIGNFTVHLSKVFKDRIIVRSTVDTPSLYLYIDKVKEFFVNKNRMVVGYRRKDDTEVEMFQETDFIHIGCAKVTKQEFTRAYIQLIKNLKTRQNERSSEKQNQS